MQLPLDTQFFPFIVDFYFIYGIKKFTSDIEYRTNLPDDKHISKPVYLIPLSEELKQKYNRDFVNVINFPNQKYNCWAACDINDELVFDHIKNIVK